MLPRTVHDISKRPTIIVDMEEVVIVSVPSSRDTLTSPLSSAKAPKVLADTYMLFHGILNKANSYRLGKYVVAATSPYTMPVEGP